MIDHLTFGVADLRRAAAFDDEAFAPLGVRRPFDASVAQGEGAPSHSETPHFQAFIAIRAELEALRPDNPAFAPAHPAARNPVLRRPPRPKGRVFIQNPDAAAVVDLANAAYGLMLRLLARAYSLAGPSAEKAFVVDAAIGLMQAMTLLGERVARLPAGAEDPDCDAGVSFTALRDASALPSGAITYARKDGGPGETPPPVNLAAIREAGPYAFRGDLRLDGVAAGHRATLCRCGASKTKPFSDRSHGRIGFRST